jgi:oxepin-CoA hydrolase/3-oxo-5,6-dehydrosuberyl-CoA semialdehyde dehydrogenase
MLRCAENFRTIHLCIDGESHNLSRQNTFMGTHILVPKEGVAIHINAIIFPSGECWKKLREFISRDACLVKPATVTSYLTEAVVKKIIASKILPEGALQLVGVVQVICWTMWFPGSL